MGNFNSDTSPDPDNQKGGKVKLYNKATIISIITILISGTIAFLLLQLWRAIWKLSNIMTYPLALLIFGVTCVSSIIVVVVIGIILLRRRK